MYAHYIAIALSKAEYPDEREPLLDLLARARQLEAMEAAIPDEIRRRRLREGSELPSFPAQAPSDLDRQMQARYEQSERTLLGMMYDHTAMTSVLGHLVSRLRRCHMIPPAVDGVRTDVDKEAVKAFEDAADDLQLRIRRVHADLIDRHPRKTPGAEGPSPAA